MEAQGNEREDDVRPDEHDALPLMQMVTEEALVAFLVRQRWFGGKARRVASARIVDAAALGESRWLTLVDVRFEDGGRDAYVLPLAAGESAPDRGASTMVSRAGGQVIYDGLFDDSVCLALLRLAHEGGEVSTRDGCFRAPAADRGTPTDRPDRIKRTAPDQSNTSVIFGSELIMKIFRRVEPGVNPDVELSTFLTRRGFAHVPHIAGTLEYVREGQEPASVLMVQRFVPNRGNGWEVMLTELGQLFSDRRARPEEVVALAELLGWRTGELHVALASSGDPALAPERYTPEELATTADEMRERAERHFEVLERSLDTLTGGARHAAEDVLAARDSLLEAFDATRRLSGDAWRIRCHGDYHLGQTLVTDDDVIILDFEGEPARPIAERRAKSSPLRDVAGMLRSFSYAAVAALRASARNANAAADEERARAWERAAGARFLEAYRRATAASPVVPAGADDFDALLRAFVVDKAAYELAYELNNRPDWIEIPLAGLRRLAPAHIAHGEGH